MKSLKITIIALIAIVLLTGVSALTSDTSLTNKEVKKVQVNVTAMKDKKGVTPPTNGQNFLNRYIKPFLNLKGFFYLLFFLFLE